jgi:hypothetical protein
MQGLLLSFLIVLLLPLASCSSKKGSDDSKDILYGTKDYIESFVSQIKPKWFITPERFQLKNDDGSVAVHRFWDVKPEISTEKKTLNFVVTTPQGSEYGYNLDIVSGQLYLEKKYCAQRDVWKDYPEDIKFPPFTIGIVPRVMDQLATPQKIIVFGNGDYYRKHYKSNYFDARIVGGFIEQTCPIGTCVEPNSWYSRLILVGVQRKHPRYKDVKNLQDLKKLEDWKEIEAFVENGKGHNQIAGKFYPAFRMGALVDASQAMYFLEKNTKIFTVKDLKQLKISCYKLYDHIWRDLKYVNKIEQPAKSKKEIVKKARVMQKDRAKIVKKVELFHKRYIRLFKRFNREFKTCSKYVYSTNINYDKDRHWFFAYINAFFKLHDLGYYYDCSRNIWDSNPLVAKGKRLVSLKQQMRSCSARDIDMAFEVTIQFLKTLKKKDRNSFRYIDYDRGAIGTHSKIYSWVKTSGKMLSCSERDDKEFAKNLIVFPSDVHWKKRETQGKTGNDALGDIIY